MKKNESVYLLDWDIKRFDKSDVEYDGFFTPFDYYKETSYLMDINDYELPDNIYVDAFFDLLAQINYPMTDLFWPIMDKKMYEVLLSCGNFNHNPIPIIMVDSSIAPKNRFDKNEKLHSSVRNDNYVALHLKSYAELFDYDKSDYDPHELFPEDVGFINNLVLKEDSEELPPIFRLKECMARIFVSHYAKEALTKAGIKGLSFKSLSEVH